MYKLEIRDVNKRYQINNKDKNKSKESFLLNINNLSINEGEFFGLIGASGCGKTTLLKIIAGLLSVDTGEIHMNGSKVTNVPTEKRKISMVFQQPLLFPHMTIEQNTAFGLKVQKVNKKERIQRVGEALKAVGLEGFQKRYPKELSGGQQQRAAIARAIVCKPEILLMDEPFSALDPQLRDEMRTLILKVQKEYNITVIFVTHDIEEAFILFNRMAIIKDGEILQIGSPKELYENPENTYVAEFLGIKNVFHGRVVKNLFISDKFKMYFDDGVYDGCNGNIILRPEYFEIKKIIKNNVEQRGEDTGVVDQKSGELYGVIKEVSFRHGFLFLKIEINLKTIEIVQQPQLSIDYKIGEKVSVKYNRSVEFLQDV